MENASKALAIAGGILLALMIIGALVLAFNKISDYQKTTTDSQKSSQLALFNMDFEKYTDDNLINGSDVISLANKIIDYNRKEAVSNSVNYDIKMSLTVTRYGCF